MNLVTSTNNKLCLAVYFCLWSSWSKKRTICTFCSVSFFRDGCLLKQCANFSSSNLVFTLNVSILVPEFSLSIWDSTLLCYISLVKYSTGWRPPIGWCRSETDLPQPNLTNFDPVFCKKYLVIWIWEKTFFWGPHGHFFGPGEAFFSTFWRFAKIEGRPSISANYLTGELWASSTLLPPLFLMKCIAWFPTPNGSEIQVSYQHSIKCDFKMLFVTEWLTDIFVVFQTISFVLPLFGLTVAPSDWSSTIQLLNPHSSNQRYLSATVTTHRPQNLTGWIEFSMRAFTLNGYV